MQQMVMQRMEHEFMNMSSSSQIIFSKACSLSSKVEQSAWESQRPGFYYLKQVNEHVP